MYSTTIHDFRIKQDEMLQQAEQFRLIRSARVLPSPASRLLSVLTSVIVQLFSF